jgi:hypothetical protein
MPVRVHTSASDGGVMGTSTRIRNIATGAAIIASLSLGVGLAGCAEQELPTTADRNPSVRVESEVLRAEQRSAALRADALRRATIAEQDALRGQLRSRALFAPVRPDDYRDQAERRAGNAPPSSEATPYPDQIDRRLHLAH